MSPLQRVTSWLQFTENQNGHHQGAGSKPGPAAPWLPTCSRPPLTSSVCHLWLGAHSLSPGLPGIAPQTWQPGLGEWASHCLPGSVARCPCPPGRCLWTWPACHGLWLGSSAGGRGPGTYPRWKLLNSPACPGWPRPCYLLCQKAAGSEHPGLQGASGIPARSL